MGAGSTYLRVVKSIRTSVVSDIFFGHMLSRFYTLLRVDLLLKEKVNANNDQVRDDIQRADARENLRIFEWYLLRHLHHTEDDDQVGATLKTKISLI